MDGLTADTAIDIQTETVLLYPNLCRLPVGCTDPVINDDHPWPVYLQPHLQGDRRAPRHPIRNGSHLRRISIIQLSMGAQS